MADPFGNCVYCPRLCRHVCPVALASDREAATPTAVVTAAWMGLHGLLDPDEAWRLASLCTGCGACTAACLHHVDVPALLSAARRRLKPAPRVDLPLRVEMEGVRVAVLCDARDWAAALGRRLGLPVARLATRDHLGEALLDHPRALARHAARIRNVLGGRRPVSACARCRAVLEAASIPHDPLEALVPPHWKGPLAACSHPGTCAAGHGPLARIHPDLAAVVAREAASHLPSLRTTDAALRAVLRAAGLPSVDLVDHLLDQTEGP